MDSLEQITKVLDGIYAFVKDSPVLSILATVAWAVLAWFAKGIISNTTADLKAAKTEVETQLTRLASLEKAMLLYLRNAEKYQDGMFDAYGNAVLYLTPALLESLQEVISDPQENKVKDFLVALRSQIKELKGFVPLNEDTHHTQLPIGPALLAIRRIFMSLFTLFLVTGIVAAFVLYLSGTILFFRAAHDDYQMWNAIAMSSGVFFSMLIMWSGVNEFVKSKKIKAAFRQTAVMVVACILACLFLFLHQWSIFILPFLIVGMCVFGFLIIKRSSPKKHA